MKFISDGTWFDKGTEVKIIDEGCTVWSIKNNAPTLAVLASGLKDDREDEEICSMDEFHIVSDDYVFEK